MYKLENTNKSLLEFNYNAGIVGKTGQLTRNAQNALPQLLSEPFLLSEYDNNKYIGAAGMFTGSPYIVMGNDCQTNLLDKSRMLTVPYLRFANLQNQSINKEMNRNIISDVSERLEPISL